MPMSMSMSPSAPGGAPTGSQPAEMSYTVDGDLYRCTGALRIGVGPRVVFVQPNAAKGRRRGAALGQNARTTLIAPAVRDTIGPAR
jgi:hypothetical protein